MKTCVLSIISLIAGLALGWHFGYRACDRQMTNVVHEMAAGGETSQAMTATIAAATVRYIDAGDISNAVRQLAQPIASYYCVYGTRAGTNSERVKVRDYIDQTAGTNPIVAAQIKKETGWTSLP